MKACGAGLQAAIVHKAGLWGLLCWPDRCEWRAGVWRHALVHGLQHDVSWLRSWPSRCSPPLHALVCLQGLFFQDFPPKDQQSPQVGIVALPSSGACGRHLPARAARAALQLQHRSCKYGVPLSPAPSLRMPSAHTDVPCLRSTWWPRFMTVPALDSKLPSSPPKQASPFAQHLEAYIRVLRLPPHHAPRALAVVAAHDFSAARAHLVASGEG